MSGAGNNQMAKTGLDDCQNSVFEESMLEKADSYQFFGNKTGS